MTTRVGSLGFLALALSILGITSRASADPADSWVRSGGSFRKVGPGRWQEFAGATKIYDFEEYSRTATEIKLYDRSRNVSVYLNDKEALIYKDGSYWFKYSGRFIFTVFAYTGGEFRFLGSGRWQEWAGGKLVYSFREVGAETANVVRLYDASRDISVEIQNTQFTVSQAGAALWSKAGRWAR